ncbi:hypothetical protein LJC58_08025 [Lachnospiraceae bacterium OttesenSCG-928-D06]|nr:hypothetical protein [Lachnospiraceae bacterium OttesenSCG-928-D06]
MFDSGKKTTNEVKEVLQLYAQLERLRTLNAKINFTVEEKIKNDINKNGNENISIESLENSLEKLADSQIEFKKNIKMFNDSVIKILNVYEGMF